MAVLDSCEGLPINDYRHKWKDEGHIHTRGYDPRMRKFTCKRCGMEMYKAPLTRQGIPRILKTRKKKNRID